MKTQAKLFPRMVKERTIDRIGKIIREYIIQHKLETGMELPAERKLAEQLGVSRFTLREALRVAKTQGLIEIVPGRKPRVAEPSGAAAANVISLSMQRGGVDLMELTEARMGLECQIARLAAVRAGPEELTALRENLAQMEQQRDVAACVELDMEFHRILLEASKNKAFAIMLNPLTQLLYESRTKTMQSDITHALVGHRMILAAMEKGDAKEAVQAMEEHMLMTIQDLKYWLETKSLAEE